MILITDNCLVTLTAISSLELISFALITRPNAPYPITSIGSKKSENLQFSSSPQSKEALS